jgi:hypothetical protein
MCPQHSVQCSPKNVILHAIVCIRQTALQKQFGITLTGTSFQASDSHFIVTDTDDLFIFPLGGNSHNNSEIVKHCLSQIFWSTL